MYWLSTSSGVAAAADSASGLVAASRRAAVPAGTFFFLPAVAFVAAPDCPFLFAVVSVVLLFFLAAGAAFEVPFEAAPDWTFLGRVWSVFFCPFVFPAVACFRLSMLVFGVILSLWAFALRH